MIIIYIKDNKYQIRYKISAKKLICPLQAFYDYSKNLYTVFEKMIKDFQKNLNLLYSQLYHRSLIYHCCKEVIRSFIFSPTQTTVMAHLLLAVSSYRFHRKMQIELQECFYFVAMLLLFQSMRSGAVKACLVRIFKPSIFKFDRFSI